MYEYFEHTADLGIRVRATDRNSLFAEAATALFAAVVEDLSSVQPAHELQVALRGDELEYLLFDWLRELLIRFDAEHMLFSKFEVEIKDGSLKGRAWGEPLDRSRHVLEHEIKAITYHGLKVEQTADDWLAEFIVDI